MRPAHDPYRDCAVRSGVQRLDEQLLARQSAIEHEARRDLPPETVAALERLGLLTQREVEPADVREAAEATLGLEALAALQTWVESRLCAARVERPPGGTREEEPLRMD